MANAVKVDEAGEQEEKDKKAAGCPRGRISSYVPCPSASTAGSCWRQDRAWLDPGW